VAAFNTGGYSIHVNPGTYTVTASGGQLATPLTQIVTVGTMSTRLNFTPQGTRVDQMPSNLFQVAQLFTHSTENFQHFVTNAYQTYLKRNPGASEVNFWVTAMSQGATDEQVEANFIGSAEYIANHGGTSRAWVSSMYQDLLGRTAAPSEIDWWLQNMARGTSASDVALGFAASAEREGQRISATYLIVLGRRATPAEVNWWVARFQQGASNEDVAAGFLASPEFYNNLGHGNLVNWLQSVYQDVLHRWASSGELAYWQAQLH
jgi:hypothetical protein